MEENLEHSDWMKGIKETGFTVPSGYFDDLNTGIKARISAERLRNVVQETGYDVPDGYFEKLHTTILTKTTSQSVSDTKPKVVRLWRSNILKYASAACFLIVAGAGIYFNYNQPATINGIGYTDAAAEQMLFDIDEEVIIEHIEANYRDEQKPTATEEALENYILNNYSQNDLTGNL
ncbi:MAG TPA: hypothetical protein VKB19_12670 [Pedobacter sp.]|nr:hypothetical protein [Pedobacter sp.]